MKKTIIYFGLLVAVSIFSVFPNQNALAVNSGYVKECIYTYREGTEPVNQYYTRVNEIYMPCPQPPLHPQNHNGELHPLDYDTTIGGVEFYVGTTENNKNCTVTAQSTIKDGGSLTPEIGF